MIITVTMNPAIDKTIMVDKFYAGGLNRIENPLTDAGGKGINVSKTIHALGGKTLATGFLGKNGSEKILACLQEENIASDFVMVDGITRTNMKIMEKDGTLTEINEQGMWIPQEKIEELVEKLTGYANEDSLFVFAGSIPKGVDTSIYGRLTAAVREKGAKVFVDADGELLKEAIKACPDMLKPNHVELAEYFGKDIHIEEAELVELARKLIENKAELVAVSRGSKGALFVTKSQVIRCCAIDVEVHSTVGAGDAMVAALVYARQQDFTLEETVRLAMAASAGAVTTAGTKSPDRETIEALKKQVRLEIGVYS
ncbi:MAG: 1-phosphofructokinase [Lachnospiraceae bacterium]|nr:1-phosphofructokinase [Lachnospiraceae bacterium]